MSTDKSGVNVYQLSYETKKYDLLESFEKMPAMEKLRNYLKQKYGVGRYKIMSNKYNKEKKKFLPVTNFIIIDAFSGNDLSGDDDQPQDKRNFSLNLSGVNSNNDRLYEMIISNTNRMVALFEQIKTRLDEIEEFIQDTEYDDDDDDDEGDDGFLGASGLDGIAGDVVKSILKEKLSPKTEG